MDTLIILFIFLAVLCIIVLITMNMRRKQLSRPMTTSSKPTWQRNAELDAQLAQYPDIQAMANTNKIQAIKLLRERTGVGLKEAKDAIDRFTDPKRISISMPPPVPMYQQPAPVSFTDFRPQQPDTNEQPNNIIFTSVNVSSPSSNEEIQAQALGHNIAARMAEVTQALAAGDKIQAIKLFRDATGASLKDAKESVERMMDMLQTQRVDPFAQMN
ncbi:MAG: ribosomal protein L7/L12, partial [Chloroflexota bacterium]|nr:ribosomal protein L7/L12 [Chloroflexota bacterium]